mgnify:FL=1
MILGHRITRGHGKAWHGQVSFVVYSKVANMSEYYVGGVGLSTGNFMMKAEYMIVKSAHHKGGAVKSYSALSRRV